MAYLVKPFTKNDLVPAIEMAVSRFAELQMLEAEVADLTERLETRKLVDRAKGVLQEQLELSEPDAFRWIQKTAMDLRLSMRQVAEGVARARARHRRRRPTPSDGRRARVHGWPGPVVPSRASRRSRSQLRNEGCESGRVTCPARAGARFRPIHGAARRGGDRSNPTEDP